MCNNALFDACISLDSPVDALICDFVFSFNG